MKNFQSLELSETLNKSLIKMDYNTPTPIQAQAIPLALKGRDVLGSAQTGTGKTAAFSIPLVETLLRNKNAHALVMTPTRELAKQVLDVIHQLLGPKSSINTAFIIGGDPMGKQMNQLRAKPRIIVGTPGRINDHLERGSIKLNQTNFLVLDETDRMLDMGFGIQLDRIIKYLPKERQTLMFSATLPQGIVKLSSNYLTNPERVSVGQTNVVAVKIKTDVVKIDQSEKYKELTSQLYDRTGSVIVFVKTKHGADRMAKNLRRDGFTSEALHGDLRQTKRDKVMQNFRKKNFRILIATDIAARGLDVPHIEHVVNYDLPQVAEDYIHRMGRTARAGAEGSALCFVSPQDGRKWHAIQCLIDPDAKRGPAPKEEKSRRKAPYRGRPKGGKDGYKKDFKKRDGGKFAKRNDRDDNANSDARDDARNDKKKSFGKNKSFEDKKKFGDKKPFDKKSKSKKPYVSKSDSDAFFEKTDGDKKRSNNKKRRTDFTKPKNKSYDDGGKKKSYGEKSHSEKSNGENKGGFKGKSNGKKASPKPSKGKGGGYDKFKRPSGSKPSKSGKPTSKKRNAA